METKKVFVNGQGYASNFDYVKMLDFASKVKPTDSLKKLEKLAYSMTAVNYHSTSTHLYKAIAKLKAGDKDIKAEIEQFISDVRYENETNVVFYYHEKNEDLFAFFPDTIDDSINGSDMGNSYSHIGQHSECHIKYVEESRKATEKEYKELKKELEKQGYVLVVQN